MAAITSKKHRAETTVVIVPSAPQDVAPQDGSADAAQPKRKRTRNRKPLYTGGRADGKPARGLMGTPEGYVSSMGRLVRGQFKTAEFWFLHCAAQAEMQVATYKELAADAASNPAKYARARQGVAKKELVAQIGKLEAALAARGFSAEDIAAMLNG